MSVSSILPDQAVFEDFRRQCLSTDNWYKKYDDSGMQVWVEQYPTNKKGNDVPKVHKIKCQITITDVSAATMYDVLHDGVYRKTWDPAMLESFDIARLSENADVGYYSWGRTERPPVTHYLCHDNNLSEQGLCPKPIKSRDVVTLRSWQVTGDEYTIVNFSVKHPKYPPRSDRVRAVSIITGYFIKSTGPNSCTFIYLSQADPKGTLPKWVVNTATRALAPRVMTSVYKAGRDYPQWKQKPENQPNRKPWLYPEQSTLRMMDPAELSIQRANSLENVDESSKVDAHEDRSYIESQR